MTRRFTGLWADTWSIEITSFAFALACYVAIVALLVTYDGEEVQKWKFTTLNAVVALFSTLAKAGLALVLAEGISQWKWIWFSRPQKLVEFEYIDSASRGVLGSLRVLAYLRWRSLVSFGAFLTLLGLPLEAFVQQVIGTRTHLEFAPSSQVTLKYATRYSGGHWEVFNVVQAIDISGNRYNYVDIVPDFDMQSAVQNGLSTPLNRILQQIPFQCPTGSCNWPLMQSLAVCSKCTDLSSQISQSTHVGPFPDIPGQSSVKSGNLTRYSLNSVLYMDDALEVQTKGGPELHYEPMVIFSAGNASMADTLKDIDTLFWASTAIRFVDNSTGQGSLASNATIQALQCGLFYCVKSYNTTFINGSVSTVSQDVHSTRDPASWNGITPNNVSSSFPAVSSLDRWNPYYYIDRTDLRLMGPGNTAYNLSQSAILSISQQLHAVFSQRGYIVSDVGQKYNPQAMQPLFQSPDLNATFEGLAASLTNLIREDADPIPPLTGQSGRMITRWQVRWGWMVLPLVVLGATLIFLVLTAIETRREAVAKLKSSSLAVLKAGAHFSHPGILADAKAASDMEETAKREKVQLIGVQGSIGGQGLDNRTKASFGSTSTELRPMLGEIGREASEGQISQYSLTPLDTAYSSGYPTASPGSLHSTYR